MWNTLFYLWQSNMVQPAGPSRSSHLVPHLQTEPSETNQVESNKWDPSGSSKKWAPSGSTKWDQVDPLRSRTNQVDLRSETNQVDPLVRPIKLRPPSRSTKNWDQPSEFQQVRPIKLNSTKCIHEVRPTKWNSLRSETNQVDPLKDETESSQVEFTESDQPSGIKHTLVAATKWV